MTGDVLSEAPRPANPLSQSPGQLLKQHAPSSRHAEPLQEESRLPNPSVTNTSTTLTAHTRHRRTAMQSRQSGWSPGELAAIHETDPPGMLLVAPALTIGAKRWNWNCWRIGSSWRSEDAGNRRAFDGFCSPDQDQCLHLCGRARPPGFLRSRNRIRLDGSRPAAQRRSSSGDS